MNIILLSGGSGKRLWPLSNDTRSKQFLKLLKNDQGTMESMLQRVYGQIQKAGIEGNILIATGTAQVDSIRSQLGDRIDIVIEPERRDTFPAIALSCIYLADKKQVDPEEIVLVLPVDPYTDLEYFKTLIHMGEAVKQNMADLVLMGIKPYYPSSKYGYIVPVKASPCNPTEVGPYEKKELEDRCRIHRVERFTEKPTKDMAQQLIMEGAVWNGGVFAFRLGYLLDIVRQYLPEEAFDGLNYEGVRNRYSSFKKISFDYEVVEKAASIAMVLYKGSWKDLGTWNSLAQELNVDCIGQVTIGENTVNTTVINELSIPAVVLGVENLIVAASPDGILISDKQKSSYLKAYVDGLSQRPMYEEGIWGEYKALDYIQYEDGTKSLTKHLTIKAGQFLGYLAHRVRDEILTIVNGSGNIVIDGEVREVKRGDIVSITRGQRHSIMASKDSDLHYIEVQIGPELVESDAEPYEWQW